MLYRKKYGFGKINRDVAPDKRDAVTHFDIVNMETYLTDRGMSLKVMPAPGDKTDIDGSNPVPPFADSMFIIGDTYIDNRLFIWGTYRTALSDPMAPSPGDDGIFEIIDDGITVSIVPIYVEDMGLSTEFPIDAVGYKDSIESSKVYWVDGNAQARVQDVDNPTDNIDFLLDAGVGGLITATRTATRASENAVARYAFQMYNIGGQASKLSAFTQPINLSEENGSALITITGMSDVYNTVRVYRLIYRTEDSPPQFELIWDTAYAPPGNLSFEDTGGLFISSVSIEDIINLGGDLVRPHTLVPKFQRLFFGNLQIEPYEVLPEDFDTRAYGFAANVTTFFIKNVGGAIEDYTVTSNPTTWPAVPFDHDAINSEPLLDHFTLGSVVEGAEGPNITIKIRWIYSGDFIGTRNFKQGETYRIGVTYRDKFGRWSNARWVTDILIPYVDYRGAYCGLEATFKTLPADAVQAKMLVVERQLQDKTILMQGVPQNLMENLDKLNGNQSLGISPYPFMRGLAPLGNAGLLLTADPFDIQTHYINGLDYETNARVDIAKADPSLAILVSPESITERTDPAVTSAVFVGTIEMRMGSTYMKLVNEGYLDGQPTSAATQTFFKSTVEGQAFPYDKPLTKPNTQVGFVGSWTPTCILSDFEDFDSGTPTANGNVRINYMYHRSSTGNVREMINREEPITEMKFLDFDNVGVVGGFAVQNSVDYQNFAANGQLDNGIDSNLTDLETEGISKYLIEFTNSDWSGNSNYDWFENPTQAGDMHFPVIDIKRSNPTQYGGQTYESKTSNIYIDASEAGVGGDTKIMFGDTYIGKFAFPYNTGARRNLTGGYTTVYDFCYIQLESSVDPLEYNIRLDDAFSTTQALCEQRLGLESRNHMQYDEVFSQQDVVTVTPGKPFNFISVDNYQYRIVPTLIKFPGSVIDPWTEVIVTTNIDLEGIYGPIVKLIKLNDNIIAFQPRAISHVKVLPTAQITTSSGQVQLGKGGILDEYEIQKVEVGASNIESIKVVDGQIFFIDARNKTLNSFQDGQVSVLYGFNTITREQITEDGALLNENVQDGQFVAIDRNNANVFFRFDNNTGVLVYNYMQKAFTHRRQYGIARRFISFNNFVYMSYAGFIYKHNSGVIGPYFGFSAFAALEMWVEPLPGIDKVYDALELLKRGDIFTNIQIDSDTRTSGDVLTDFKSKYDIHTTYLPRVFDSRDRWRERNIKILLTYTGDEDFEVDAITLKFSIKKG